MRHFDEPTARIETLRRRALLDFWLGMAALLLAGLLVPTPETIAAVTIAGAGLLLLSAQRFISHRLIARSVEVIGEQEALLAGFAAEAPGAGPSGFLRRPREHSLNAAPLS